ncbi:DUF6801 domain-containing protein [Streptomyces sp. NPDC047821]|uniref:DUF6801 domain-containing protein n=1 Tax=Streptomyces sp. NPDC047821 TaxID=3365488 RepID=UPI00371F7397
MRRTRAAAVGAAVLVAGMIPGTGVALDEGGQTVDAELAYRCVRAGETPAPEGADGDSSREGGTPAPEGADVVREGEAPARDGGRAAGKATVRVSAVLPRQVLAGRPVQAEDVAVRVTLPPEAVAALTEQGATSAGGAVSLTTTVTRPGGEPSGVPWSQLAVPDTGLPAGPAAEPYTVEARGAVPPVTAGPGGDLTFSAGALGLDLLPRRADGTPTTPPNLSFACTPEPGADPVFARVTVRRAPVPVPGPGREPSAPPPATGAPAPAPGPGTAPVRPPRPGRGDTGGPTASDDCEEPPPVPSVPVKGHGYLAGYANVAKLGGAMFLKDPGLLRVNMNKMVQIRCPTPNGPFATLYSDATLDHRGKPRFPPVRATFLTFGFMPTTATAELTLDGPIEIATDAYPIDLEQGRLPEVSTATARLWVRLYDVEVNGTPLDVGPACRTARPMRLVLTGRGYHDFANQAFGYTVDRGGPLTGTAEIPEFRGCGAKEDLDPLFTASVSGRDNFTRMTQGPLCTEQDATFCPDPPRPKPQK